MIDAFGLAVPEHLQDACKPHRCALIIYDMQVGIVPQVPDGLDVLGRCRSLLATARQQGFRVFFTRHFFLPLHLAGAGQLHRSMIWQKTKDPQALKSSLTQHSPASQIVPELAPNGDEVVIDKITMSAFESTFLNIAMRDAHLDSFIIAGIALEVGIEPTVRHALDLNLLPIVASDACGSRNQSLKDRSLATLTETGEVRTFSTDQIIAAMRGDVA